jgi:hypothetical protein
MLNIKRNLLKATLTLLLTLTVSASLWAQPGFDDDVNDTPIDGGIALLVAAGIGYGLNKVNQARKSKD